MLFAGRLNLLLKILFVSFLFTACATYEAIQSDLGLKENEKLEVVEEEELEEPSTFDEFMDDITYILVGWW